MKSCKVSLTVLLWMLVVAACTKGTEASQTLSHSNFFDIVRLSADQRANAGVTIGSPLIKTMHSTIRLNGTLDVPPTGRSYVSNPLGGFVKAMSLLPGARVKKGEVLIVMEDAAYIELQQAYLVAKNRLHYLETDLKRQADLNVDKSTSDKVFQQATSDYENQKILVKSLYERLQLINVDVETLTEQTISRAVKLYSPVDGYVSAVNVSVGKYVDFSEPLFELVDDRSLQLTLTVFEKDLPYIVVGQQLDFTAAAVPDKKYSAVVTAVNRTLTHERSSEVHCDVIGSGSGLSDGMFATASLSIGSENVVVIPEEAIVNWDNHTYVFVALSPDTFKMTPVETGMRFDGFVELEGDIGKDKIVTRNAYVLLMELKKEE